MVQEVQRSQSKKDPWLNDEAKLSYSVAAGSFGIGGLGWCVNQFAPETTMLDSLFAVGCLYSLMGFNSSLQVIWKKGTSS